MSTTPESGIAYFLQFYPELRQSFVRDEIEGLARVGLSIDVVAVKPGHALDDVNATSNLAIDLQYLPPPRGLALWWLAFLAFITRPIAATRLLWQALWLRAPGGTRPHRGKLAGYAWRGLALARWLTRGPLQHVRHLHSHFDEYPLVSVVVAARLTGRTYSVTVHTVSDVVGLDWKLGGAAFVVFVSQYAANATLGAMTVEAPAHRIVHCGIDIDSWPARAAPPTRLPPLIFSVGALIGVKGHAVLIAAVARLHASGRAIELEIAGEGDERPRLMALIREHNLESSCRLQGAIPRVAIKARLMEAAVFVLACRRDDAGNVDGIPVALMEAMACGVPVVSTRISGIPELIEDGHSGLLIESDDGEALALAIERILADSRLAARLSEGARHRIAAEFTLAGQVREMSDLFRAQLRGSDGH